MGPQTVKAIERSAWTQDRLGHPMEAQAWDVRPGNRARDGVGGGPGESVRARRAMRGAVSHLSKRRQGNR
jgi:hypothetical protein